MNDQLLSLLEDQQITLNLKEEKYFHNGIPVPRVTEIISKMISEEYLMYWANSLGFKHQSYKKTIEAAANIGSESHDLINKFLLGETFTSDNIPYLGFRKWWMDINMSNSVKVIGTEQTITCEYFGGTYDLLVEIDGLLYLVDFKTSNYIGYKHFIQLSAYKYILESRGYQIAGCIILQLNKQKIEYTEYPVLCTVDNGRLFMNRCLNTFFSLVYGYYNINQCQNMYNEIF